MAQCAARLVGCHLDSWYGTTADHEANSNTGSGGAGVQLAPALMQATMQCAAAKLEAGRGDQIRGSCTAKGSYILLFAINMCGSHSFD